MFGPEPEETLIDHGGLIDRSRPVLDIGAGQGRNTLFLARQGFQVDAIDPSKVAVNQIETHAVRENLPVRVFACGFDTFSPDIESYAGIAVYGIVPQLSPPSIQDLIAKILDWTGEGSVVFLTAFTTADPAFNKISRTLQPVGKNSFRDDEWGTRTYLEPGEILDFFPDFDVIHHWEGMGPEHRHGAAAPERHAMTEAVLLRPPL